MTAWADGLRSVDRTAAARGQPGRSGVDEVLALFKRAEAHELGGGEYRGACGSLPVSTIGTPHPLSAAFVEGAMTNGHSLIEDFNTAQMAGVATTTPPRAVVGGQARGCASWHPLSIIRD
jgi:hypothetical protein